LSSVRLEWQYWLDCFETEFDSSTNHDLLGWRSLIANNKAYARFFPKRVLLTPGAISYSMNHGITTAAKIFPVIAVLPLVDARGSLLDAQA
jgi:hypothetical protein